MNQWYKHPEMLGAMREELQKNHLILIDDILSEKALKLIKQALPKDSKEECIPDQGHYFRKNAVSIKKVFNQEFIGNISKIIKKRVMVDIEILEFRQKCFTILHDEFKQDYSHELIMFLANDWDLKYGGRFVVIKKGEEKFEVVPQTNRALLVECKQTQSYIEYINHLAKNKKFSIIKIKIKSRA